jgi:branched-chain amino acid transport system permease protein
MTTPSRRIAINLALIAVVASIPVVEKFVPLGWHITDPMTDVFVYAILGLGLNILTGFTGLLNLGVAAFAAIGAYVFAISTCEIYPFQLGFWSALGVTMAAGALAGFALGAPTLRVRGDYLAIVTLGFGEIVKDVLVNMDSITKGTQGINPLPAPTLFGTELTGSGQYWLFMAIVLVVVFGAHRLERSRIGRGWISIREDELASRAMGIRPDHAKMLAFATCASLAALAGALTASRLSSSGEPGNYDFQISILALCIVIVGGLGSVRGVLLGALVMVGMNSIVLVKLTELIGGSDAAPPSALAEAHGLQWAFLFTKTWAQNVLISPTNWKFLVFGLALVLMMIFRPEGILPTRGTKEDAPEDSDAGTGIGGGLATGGHTDPATAKELHS